MAKNGVWAVGVGVVEGEHFVVVADESAPDVVSLVHHDTLPSPVAIAEQVRAAFAERGRPRKIVVPDGGLAKALRSQGIREPIVVGSAPRLAAALAAIVIEDEDDAPLDLARVSAFESAMAKWAPTFRADRLPRFVVQAPGIGVENGMLTVVTVADRAGWIFYFDVEDLRTVRDANERGREGFDADTMVAYVTPLEPDAEPEEREASRRAGLGELQAMLLRNRRVGPKEPRDGDYGLAAVLTEAVVEILASERSDVVTIVRRIGEAEVKIWGPLS